jgi:hypothetical protein
MPYVRCHQCEVANYLPVPWSHAAECPQCGAAMDVARNRPPEHRPSTSQSTKHCFQTQEVGIVGVQSGQLSGLAREDGELVDWQRT